MFSHVDRPVGRPLCQFVGGCRRVFVIFFICTAIRPFLLGIFLESLWGNYLCRDNIVNLLSSRNPHVLGLDAKKGHIL